MKSVQSDLLSPTVVPADHFLPPLGEQLAAQGLVSADQLQVALHEQQRQGGLLGQILCRLSYLTDMQLASALAARAELALLENSALVPEPSVLRLLSASRARQWQVLPLRYDDDALVVACADPFDIVAQNQLQASLGAAQPVRYGVAAAQALQLAIDTAYGDAVGGTAQQAAPAAGEIAAWLSALLQEAVALHASDVHCVPEAQALRIRLRVDGVLHTVKTMHRDFWPALLQRLKILAGVNIAESRRPQDGRFTELCDGVAVDCRVGFMPTTHGEAVALRLLDPRQAQRSFAAMGFAPFHIAQLQGWLQRPEGLLLVTGPTGSGKSTTLNAMLQALDRTTRNIMTLEDPVEYHFDGIRQTQVQEQHGMSFAEGVRTLLRHDPDVILIGEIRDAATAQQAMRAAMTGHLVLSSLHTASAAGAVPRLLDLGVSRDLLAQHLRGVVAQRLVRTLCPHCTKSAGQGLRLVAQDIPVPETCAHCFGTGRRGRTVVAELFGLPKDSAALFGGAVPRERSLWAHGMSLVQAGRVALADLAATVPQQTNALS